MATKQIDKPKYEAGSIKESFIAQGEAVLWSDMERFSNGHLHMGWSLATFQHEGKEGQVTGGGKEITVSVNGRTWGISLETLIEAAIQADEKYTTRKVQS